MSHSFNHSPESNSCFLNRKRLDTGRRLEGSSSYIHGKPDFLRQNRPRYFQNKNHFGGGVNYEKSDMRKDYKKQYSKYTQQYESEVISNLSHCEAKNESQKTQDSGNIANKGFNKSYNVRQGGAYQNMFLPHNSHMQRTTYQGEKPYHNINIQINLNGNPAGLFKNEENSVTKSRETQKLKKSKEETHQSAIYEELNISRIGTAGTLNTVSSTPKYNQGKFQKNETKNAISESEKISGENDDEESKELKIAKNQKSLKERYESFDRNSVKIETNPYENYEIYSDNLYDLNYNITKTKLSNSLNQKESINETEDEEKINKVAQLKSCYLFSRLHNWRVVTSFIPALTLHQEKFSSLLSQISNEPQLETKSHIVYKDGLEKRLNKILEGTNNERERVNREINKKRANLNRIKAEQEKVKLKIKQNEFALGCITNKEELNNRDYNTIDIESIASNI